MLQETKKILIIDDNTHNLSSKLSEHYFNVDVATNDSDFITKLFSYNEYDLIIIDLLLTNFIGWKLLELLKAHEATKTIPVIILTSLNNREDRINALINGADDFINKPYEFDELLARIKSLLRRSEWQKQPCINISFNYKINSDLTNRQCEILKLMSQGCSNREIADQLVLSESTIKSHLNTIFEKLCVTSRIQAALVAIKEGIAC